jgi:AmiR/NasT family two-component response regulator
MRLRATVIGALNMFSTQPGRLTAAEVKVVQALADVATIAILQERALRRSEMVTEQLQAALNSRIVIEQAKGALARIHAVTVDQAFTLLRDYSRSRNRKLGDIAHAVVTDPAGVAGLTRD